MDPSGLQHDLRWAHGPLRIAARPLVGTWTPCRQSLRVLAKDVFLGLVRKGGLGVHIRTTACEDLGWASPDHTSGRRDAAAGWRE